jgi:hypothetical protein
LGPRSVVMAESTSTEPGAPAMLPANGTMTGASIRVRIRRIVTEPIRAEAKRQAAL